MVEGAHSCRTCAISQKLDEVELSMFNKVYHTFLSNPVKLYVNCVLSISWCFSIVNSQSLAQTWLII